MTDFYQSPGDKLRLEVLLKTLSEGSLNLAILGEDDVVLAHYARRIAQHLRQHGNIEVELWTSTDSEKLVKRFNEILSEVSVDQALDKAQKAATKRYMIFPDAQGIQDIDLQLLARLVNGFPASNIHVVLLVNSLEPHERKLEAFGKSLMQWVLESENPAPKRTQRIETLDEVLPEPAPGPVEPPAVPPPLLDAVPTLQEAAPAANSWDPPATPAKKSGARLAWGLLGVMLVSLVLFGFLYKEQIQSEMEAMQGYLSRQIPLHGFHFRLDLFLVEKAKQHQGNQHDAQQAPSQPGAALFGRCGRWVPAVGRRRCFLQGGHSVQQGWRHSRRLDRARRRLRQNLIQGFDALCSLGRRIFGLQHPLHQAFPKGFQLALMGLQAVDQQHDMNIAGRKAIDQARQQLQVDVLNALRVGKNHVALGRCLLRFVQRLIDRDLRQDFIESLDQLFRVGRCPKLHLNVAVLAQMLCNSSGVVGQHHIVFAQDGQVKAAFAQGFEKHFQTKLVAGALVEISHGRAGSFKPFIALRNHFRRTAYCPGSSGWA